MRSEPPGDPARSLLHLVRHPWWQASRGKGLETLIPQLKSFTQKGLHGGTVVSKVLG